MSTCAVGPCQDARADGSLYCGRHGPSKRSAPTPKGRPTLRENLVCPHCHVSGHVVGRPVKVRRGVSRKKVASALLTGAASLAVVGIGHTQTQTELSCRACGMTWRVG